MIPHFLMLSALSRSIVSFRIVGNAFLTPALSLVASKASSAIGDTSRSESSCIPPFSGPGNNSGNRLSVRMFASSSTSTSSTGPSITHIGKSEMKSILEDRSNANDIVVMDVRTDQEVFYTGKLAPCVHTVPLQMIMEKNLFQLDPDDFEDITGFAKPEKDATLVFSCAAGVRSVYACQFASQAGYSKLVNYVGGSNDWFSR